MRRFSLAWVGLSLLVSLAGVALSRAEPAQAGQGLQPTTMVRYLHPVFPSVVVDSDLVYKKTTDHLKKPIELKLDVYQPKGDSEASRPAVIWVHGGYMATGSKEEGIERQFAESFARRGYVTVNIDYRLRPNPDADFNGTILDAMRDVESALGWLRKNAKKYRVDLDRVALAGYSAGAEMITNLCYTDYVKGMDRKQVKAIVDIAGNTLFFSDPFEDSPACLIVHGTTDTVNPYSASENLRDRLKKKKIEVELVGIVDADHLFNRDPAKLGEVEVAIARFLHKQLAAPLSPPS